MTTAPLYTTSEYAAALGIGVRAARKALGVCLRAAGRARSINGRRVRACPVSALPPSVMERLTARAAVAGCQDAAEWLTRCANPGQPDPSLAEWHPANVARAVRRRAALAPVLQTASASDSVAALTRAAVRSLVRLYPEERQDERTVRRWLERARSRDRGRGEWERLELYLDDRLIRPECAGMPPRVAVSAAGVLREALGLLADPARADLEDKPRLWCAAMEEIERRVEHGQSEREARTAVLAVLMQTGVPLGRNRRALQRSLERKHRQWRQGADGANALKDRRLEASGRFRAADLPAQDRQRLLARALGCGGRLAQAYREL